MEFSGRLAAFPIADLLSWAHNDRRSGSLVVRRSGTEKRVYFHDGDVVACLSSDPVEFYGQFLLAQGYVDHEGLVHALRLCQRERVLLGAALARLGLLTSRRVQQTLQTHVEDQVCELFLWKSGIFYFTNETLPADQVLPTPLPAAGLALEGSRRADEYARVRRLFVHDNIVLRRGEKTPPRPAPLEQRILEQVDGTRSLLELYNDVRGSWFRFLVAAYRLTVAGVLDIEEVNDPADSGSTELRLADLLLEQVAEERAVLFRHHLSLPFDAIEHCVPVWVRSPSGAEQERWSDGLRDFFDRVDGRTDLATLFGTVPVEERAARMDRLVLQFREGNVALLPASLEELDRRAGSEAAAAPSEAAPAPGAAGAEPDLPEGAGRSDRPWWRRLGRS
jgi:hypothetical protein